MATQTTATIRKIALFSKSIQALFQLYTHKTSLKFDLSYCTSCSLTGSPRNQLPPLPTRALLHLPLPTSCSLPEDCPQQTPQSRHSRPLLASLPANTNCKRKKSPFILYSRDRTPTSLYTDMTFFISLPLEILHEVPVLCRERGRRKGSDNWQCEHTAFYPQGRAINSLVSKKKVWGRQGWYFTQTSAISS